MILKISHTTRYQFEGPVTYGLQQLRKTPKSYRAQNVLSWNTSLAGGTHELAFEDFHRNRVELISLQPDIEELIIRSEGEVEMTDTHGIVGPHSGPAPLWLYERQTPLTRPGRGCRAIVADVPEGETLAQMHSLSSIIADRVTYEIGVSEPGWSAEEAISAGKGVCQDHAHIFITCARLMGRPARYVSGFLMMEDRTDQEATHAWAEAHLDNLGWVGFDVSNGISPDMRYVRVATGLDYDEAAPTRGVRVGGASENLSVSVKVAQQ
ncbi:MAG: transglutaminase family protein [Pseudomonadota bacterium]